MKFSTTLVTLALLVVGVAAALVIALSRPATAAAVPETKTIASQPSDVVVPQNLKSVGSLTTASQATLSFQMGGKIQEIDVKEGDHVKAGTTIASLDTSLLDLQVAQAQAAFNSASANLAHVKAGPTTDDLSVAKANLDHTKEVLNQAQAAYDRIGGDSNPFGALSPQALALQQAYSSYQAALGTFNLTVNHPTDTELKMAQAQLDQAQAALNLAKQNVANAKIVAPFDGTVVWIGPHVGEFIAPGAPTLNMADLTHMQVSVGVDENSLPMVKVGQAATITVDAVPGQTLSGKVSKIGEQATTTSGIVSVPVTVDVDPTQAAIYPGLSATVQFSAGQ